MTRYVAFVRAINVAGHAIVKMRDLKAAFAAAGCENVATYIQSGNVLFDAAAADIERLHSRIVAELGDSIGEPPTVMLRKLGDVARLVAADPFAGVAERARAKLYVAFLAEKPARKPAFPLRLPKERLEAIGMAGRDVLIVSLRKDNGFYGFPNNFIEKELGVAATSRNWTTVTKIAKLAR